MGFGGPVDLNFQSLDFIMDMFDVKDRKVVFKRVYDAYLAGLKIIHDKIEEEKKS